MHGNIDDLLDILQDSRLAPPEEARSLIQALEEVDDHVRGNGTRDDVDLGPIRRAAQHAGEEVRKVATVALARFGDQPSQLSIQTLLNDKSTLVRQVAVKTAGALADPGSASTLVGIFTNPDEDLELRRTALLAMAKLRQPGLVAVLIDALADGDKVVRQYALSAIGDYAGVDGIDRAVEPLCAIVCSSGELPEIRARAAAALGKVGDARAADALAGCLARERDDTVQRRAALALAQLRDRRAIPLLRGMIASTGPSRLEAIRAFAAFPEQSTLETLQRTLDREADHAAAAAIRAVLADISAALPKQPRPKGAPAARTGESVPGAAGTPGSIMDIVDAAAEKLGCLAEEIPDGRSLTVPLQREGSRQAVSVTAASEEGTQVLRVMAECGPADSGNYRNALETNRMLTFGAISVREERGFQTFILCETIPAGAASVESLGPVIRYIAETANQISRQLRGV